MARWTAASRKAYHEKSPENFAGPQMSYPIKDGSDVKKAWNLAGHAANPDAVRRKIKSIAKRLGLTGSLPKTANMTVVEFTLPDGWSYSDLSDALCEAICEKYGMEGHYDKGTQEWVSGVYPWLRNFDNKVCWYCLGTSEVYQESYSVSGTEVTLGDDQLEVKIMWNAVPVTSDADETAGMSEVFDGTYDLFTETVVFFDDLVHLRVGKIFKAGEYPDKNFSITPQELAEAVKEFQPVVNKGAHVPTIFDGKMGNLESVALAEDGTTLIGTISVPKWLQDLHGADTPMRASLEWHRDTKRIVGNTIIPNPRVADSALMAAFSAAEDPPNILSGKPVGIVGRLRAFVDTLLDDDPEIDVTEEVQAVEEQEQAQMSATNGTTNEVEALKAQLAAAEKQNQDNADRIAKMAADGYKTKADAIITRLFQTRHLMPQQVDPARALFTKALELDDTGAQVVSFADDKGVEQKYDLAGALERVLMSSQEHTLTTEQAGSNPLLVLLDNGGNATNSDDPDGTKAAAERQRARVAKEEKRAAH